MFYVGATRPFLSSDCFRNWPFCEGNRTGVVAVSPRTASDSGRLPSGKGVALSAAGLQVVDCVGAWVGRYLELAVRGVRSPEVAGKITAHLARFADYMTAAYGQDRLSAVVAPRCRRVAGRAGRRARLGGGDRQRASGVAVGVHDLGGCAGPAGTAAGRSDERGAIAAVAGVGAAGVDRGAGAVAEERARSPRSPASAQGSPPRRRRASRPRPPGA